MARIENTTEGQKDLHGLKGQGPFKIPRNTKAEGEKTINGAGEIPDDVLNELLAKDPWTKGLFDSGDLVRIDGKKDDGKK